MKYQSLEKAVFDGQNLAEPIEYVYESGNPNEFFSDRHGHNIGLLHYMVMVKSDVAVTMLLDMGADPNLPTSAGDTPLWTAMTVREPEIIKLLAERGADIHVRKEESGDTLLHMALITGQTDAAQYLLDRGADPDALNKRGVSPRQIQSYNALKKATSLR